MKSNVLFFFVFSISIFMGNFCWGQSDGDYQSIGAVKVTSKTNWQVYMDGWITATEAPTNTVVQNNTITINTGNTCIYDATDANSAIWGNLVVKGTLQLGNNTGIRNLTINGNITIENGGSINVFGATSTANYNLYISGDLDNNGIFSMNNNQGYGNVYFTGVVNQYIKGSANLEFYNLTLGKSSGVIILNKSISVNNKLELTSGNIDFNGFTILLGSSSETPGSLSITSGFLTGKGAFTRYIGTSSLPTTFAGNVTRFPMGSGTNDRTLLMKFSSSSITTGGTISVSYTDGEGSTLIDPTFMDDGKNIDKRSNAYWTVSENGIDLGGTTVSVRLNAGGVGGVNNVNDLKLTRGNQAAAGTDGGSGGSIDNPTVSRSGLTINDLSNTFYIGAASTSPLPVELSSFTGKLFSNKIYLNWSTATEVDNYGFDIERSFSNHDWRKIGYVSGHGNCNSPQNYSFVDAADLSGKNDLKPGVCYYRLKQIDNDGSFSYSKEIEVNLNTPSRFALEQNYPNPFNPLTVINFQLMEDSHVHLKVYDVLGNEVKTLVDENRNAGTHRIKFNASNLSSGVYMYKLTAMSSAGQAGNFSDVKKMLVLK